MSLAFASSDQTIATFERNISQQCWPSICKRQQNDPNVSTQQMARLLGVTCCARLACRVLKIELVRMPVVARIRPNEYNIMRHPQMLHGKLWPFSNVSLRHPTCRNRVGWLNAPNTPRPTMLRYAVLRCCVVWPGLEGGKKFNLCPWNRILVSFRGSFEEFPTSTPSFQFYMGALRGKIHTTPPMKGKLIFVENLVSFDF